MSSPATTLLTCITFLPIETPILKFSPPHEFTRWVEEEVVLSPIDLRLEAILLPHPNFDWPEVHWALTSLSQFCFLSCIRGWEAISSMPAGRFSSDAVFTPGAVSVVSSGLLVTCPHHVCSQSRGILNWFFGLLPWICPLDSSLLLWQPALPKILRWSAPIRQPKLDVGTNSGRKSLVHHPQSIGHLSQTFLWFLFMCHFWQWWKMFSHLCMQEAENQPGTAGSVAGPSPELRSGWGEFPDSRWIHLSGIFQGIKEEKFPNLYMRVGSYLVPILPSSVLNWSQFTKLTWLWIQIDSFRSRQKDDWLFDSKSFDIRTISDGKLVTANLTLQSIPVDTC